jgi:hypothetical protein
LLAVLLEIYAITWCVADGKNSCFCLLRASSLLAFYYQNANAKAEFFYFCEKMSRATAPRPFRTAGFQRVLDPLARFLVTSCRVTRSNTQKSKPISARLGAQYYRP